jgi:two-component system chemotaxis sensor kinase CheA
MDDLLREFLNETGEHIDVVDVQLVRLEQEPDNVEILRNVFRLVHTIKGTCGFLGLPRLETLAHAAETLMGRLREGMPVTSQAVSLILATVDQIKQILAELERSASEPPGDDASLIAALARAADGETVSAPRATHLPGGPDVAGEGDADASLSDPILDALTQAVLADEAVPDSSQPRQPVIERREPDATQPAAAAETDDSRARGQTIRVTVDTLEHLMTMVSELVLTRNQLLEIARRREDGDFKVPLQRLSHVTAELQEGVMKTRMQPIGTAWQKLPRVLRDLSQELGKPIDLVMTGAETELDRQVIEIIRDPLTHMVRNSADHGIETPEQRRAAGKPERGLIRLSASHEGGTISIDIADDGCGLDIPVIGRAAVARGLVSEQELARLNDSQIARFIFHPGFSTATSVTSVSGRGVGMDVVRTNIELIGGTVDIRTEKGRGTVFTIKIPLTLAIVSALIVSIGEQRFAIPQVTVLELVRVRAGSDHQIETINGSPVLRLRDRLLPIVPLASTLGLTPDAGHAAGEGFVVVAEMGRHRFGMLVDAVYHTEEIVVKPMSRRLRHMKSFSGNTILGDGAVVLIIDPAGIARLVGSVEADDTLAVTAEAVSEAAEIVERTTLLVFRAGEGSLKAVPLSLVTRLEEADVTRIERSGGRLLIQYRGTLVPLVAAVPELVIRERGTQPFVIFSDGERTMGLIVDEIVDIVDEVLDIGMPAEEGPLLGSAIIRGRATDIVNVAHYLPLAHEDWLTGTRRPVATRQNQVLLVDDSAFFRELLGPVMRAGGYRVVTAATPAEAHERVAGTAGLAAIVVDSDMPGDGGFALVEALRRDPATRHLPIVMLATFAHPQMIDRARQLGVSDLVAKFDRAGLIAALNEVVLSVGEAA